MAVYIDGMEKKLDEVLKELTTVKKQLFEMQERQKRKSLKESLSKAVETLEQQCHLMKKQLFEIKAEVKTKSEEIVAEVKGKGKKALNRVVEFLGIKSKLENLRCNVQESIRGVDKTITKINIFGIGMREASQKAANTFRTLVNKANVDYSHEKRFSKIEVIKKPWVAKRKILNILELHLDTAIDKLDNLSKDIKINYEKEVPQLNIKEEVVDYGSDLMMPGKNYQYGGDAFEVFQKQNPKAVQNTTAQIGITVKDSKSR